MPQANRGTRLVALLSARSAGAIGIDLALREQLIVGERGPGRARQGHASIVGWVERAQRAKPTMTCDGMVGFARCARSTHPTVCVLAQTKNAYTSSFHGERYSRDSS